METGIAGIDEIVKRMKTRQKTEEGLRTIHSRWHAHKDEIQNQITSETDAFGFAGDTGCSIFSAKITFAAFGGAGYGQDQMFRNGVDQRLAAEALKEAISCHEELILETMANMIHDDIGQDITKLKNAAWHIRNICDREEKTEEEV